MVNYLYIHIPFCIRKCIYCDFLSVSYDSDLAERYVEALCSELSILKATAGTLKSLYIGGGTPTVLNEDCLESLFRCIHDNYSFDASPEITIEANPGTLTGQKVKIMKSFGINRVSIGVQSFNENELRTLYRVHGRDEALDAVEMIKQAGMRNFSLDLMYGIPGQTAASWKDTLSIATSLSPTHISAYELTPEENTPLYRLISRERITMPGEDHVLGMYDYAIDFLSSEGYDHYEISNYARSGFCCIHNLNYWDRGEYLGAGAGAHSFSDRVRRHNTCDIEKYIESPRSGMMPLIESRAITEEEAVREFIFLGLRKIEGISLEKAVSFGLDIPTPAAGLIEEGFLEAAGDHLRLTRKGLPISNYIVVKLLENCGL
jgi:oxygen-independent coproporphyrinogen-3 oxidase